MQSAIFEGTVWHKRYLPKEHQFSYKVFMMYLELGEIEEVLALSKFWSRSRFAIARYRQEDFFSSANKSINKSTDLSLEENIRQTIDQRIGYRPSGPIRLLANLRYFGYLINPISCFYCFDASGQNLEVVVIEVTNTPWGESTHYVLDMRDLKEPLQLDFLKEMHVSPLMPMNMLYRWRGEKPGVDIGDTLVYTLTNFLINEEDCQLLEKPVFTAGVNFKRKEITTQNLNRILLDFPFMTLKVLISIYWQALLLFLKRIKFHPHPRSSHPRKKIDPKKESCRKKKTIVTK